MTAMTLAAAVSVASAVMVPPAVGVGDLFIVMGEEGSARPAEVRFLGQSYPPILPPGWQAPFFLVGVDLDAKQGESDLSVRYDGGDHPDESFRVRIEARDFPVERLTLPPDMVTPPPELLERIAREREAAAAVYRGTTPSALWEPPFGRPVEGSPSGNFGRRRILNGEARSPHSGEDYSASRGTPVRAAADGVVRMASDLYYSGNTVLIDHGAGLVSQYFHLDEIMVREGRPVRRGEVIGRVGDTGRVTGPHLHFGLRLFGQRVNPSLIWDLFARGSGEASHLPSPSSPR